MKEQILELGKVKINYKEFGEKDSNFGDILILHGWGGKSDSWVEVAELLSEKGFRVIIPDLPGFGKTEMHKVYTLSDYSKLIEEFCKKLKLENIILWGHSNGGAISITLENRGKLNIERLVLNNSAGIRNDKKRSFKRKILKKVLNNLKFLKKIFIFKKIRILFYKAIGGHDYLNAEKSPFFKTNLS
ncbi:MAG: alpha/beta fold hydrolase [Candidatus Gracilibacteria bacterium]|nr:alpha/beta fold hydrolase [Candidatus Gracilibacteria bacterium]